MKAPPVPVGASTGDDCYCFTCLEPFCLTCAHNPEERHEGHDIKMFWDITTEDRAMISEALDQ